MPDNPTQQPTQPTPASPVFQQPPAGPGENRPAPIYLDPSVWQATNQRLAELEQAHARSLRERDEAEAERLKSSAKAGELEKSWEENDKRWEKKYREVEQSRAEIESKWLGEKKTAAIAEALNGREFAGTDPAATAALVRKLLADEVEASRDSQGNPTVYDRATRRPASEYLRERLNSPDLAIFFKASNRGGAGGDGTRTAGNGQQSDDPTGEYMRRLREQRESARRDPSSMFR